MKDRARFARGDILCGGADEIAIVCGDPAYEAFDVGDTVMDWIYPVKLITNVGLSPSNRWAESYCKLITETVSKAVVTWEQELYEMVVDLTRCLNLALSSDPEMPTHREDIDECESVLRAAIQRLKDEDLLTDELKDIEI